MRISTFFRIFANSSKERKMKKVLRIILLTINLLLVAVFLLSTMAGQIAPSKMAYVSILSYGYVMFLVTNILFIIIWLALSRWEFLISTAAIVLRYSFIPLFFQVGGCPDAENNENTLRVMTYNVHSFKGLDSDTAMKADSGARMFLQLVDEEQPDVLCLQEFFQPRKVKLADSLAARGYKYHYGVHGSNIRSQNILFSRCWMVKGHDIDRRSKFYVDLVKGDNRVRVCCVHLDSYQLTEDDMEGIEKLTHAKPDSSTHKLVAKFKETTLQHEREWIEELQPLIQKTRVPIIVAGDFNDTPASYIYQQITDTLVDPYVEQGRGFGTTYHGYYPAFRIDYVLHSPEFKTLSYKRVKTDISDHYPVVVTLQFPERNETTEGETEKK